MRWLTIQLPKPSEIVVRVDNSQAYILAGIRCAINLSRAIENRNVLIAIVGKRITRQQIDFM